MSMLAQLAKHATRHPARLALQGSRQRLNYAELHDQVVVLAEHLRSLNVRSLALALDNGPVWALFDLAALEAGVALLPIAPFFSPTQVRHALSQTAVEMIITDNAEGFRSKVSGMPTEETSSWSLLGENLTCLRTAFRETRIPHYVHKVTYTSGTTADPKGVLLSWEQMRPVVESLAQAVSVEQGDRHLVLTPLAVLLENIAGLYTALWCGACAVLPPLAETGLMGAAGLNGRRMLDTLERYTASTAIFSPQMLQGAVEQLAAGCSLPAVLRFIAVGGAAVSRRLLQRAAEVGLPVYEGYGLSECASVVTLNRPEARCQGSVGKPLPHVEIRIDRDGEVLVRGNLFSGYLGEEDAITDTSWWRTGDIGFLDPEGFLHLRGRRRHIFITTYGRNVSPEWVERELVLEPAIFQAALLGEARPWNLALIVPAPGASEQEIEQAIQRVNQGLPDYARVGQWIEADEPFTIANGGLSGTGRIRREIILQHYRDPIEALYQQDLVS